MSGVNRNILAEIMADGKSSQEEIQKALSPEAIRAEKGQTIHSPASGRADEGEYLGNDGVDVTK